MKYLALGDSYTIGELVDEKDNVPNQVVTLLNAAYPALKAPTIIAQTGWTSEELYQAVEHFEPQPDNNFDFVTLLVGVNDQYRNLSIAQYEHYFLKLLLRAILFAQGQSRRVFVLSIPDWGLTPFAQNEGKKSSAMIASEIDEFNKKNKLLTLAYRCHYIDITTLSRLQGTDERYLANDKLHYSAKAYKEWSHKTAKTIDDILRHIN